MRNRVTKKQWKERYNRLVQENISLMFRTWELESVALDAQFVLESNRITKYPEIAEDICDRVDELNLKLTASDPDDDE